MGHNISFDRAGVESEYSLAGTRTLWIDTLSRCCEWDILSPASRVEQVAKEEGNRKDPEGRSGQGYC